jgi:hypothetical protein
MFSGLEPRSATQPIDWNKRDGLYPEGQGSREQLKEHQHQQMKVNGEPVVEIDINAGHLTIYHTMRSEPFTHRIEICHRHRSACSNQHLSR